MVYKLFIISVFFIINIFSMELDLPASREKRFYKDKSEKTVPALPVQMWAEIAKLGINRNAKTEKEVFETLDNLRLVDKKINSAVDLVKAKFCKEHNIAEKDCSYPKFKLKIIDQIISERVKNVEELINENKNYIEYNKRYFNLHSTNFDSNIKPSLINYLKFQHKVNIALDMNAKNWLKEYFFKNSEKFHDYQYNETNYKDAYLKHNYEGLIRSKDKNKFYRRVNALLEIGSNPNLEINYQDDVIKPIFLAVYYEYLDAVNLFLKYNADTNLKDWYFINRMNSSSTRKKLTPLELAKDLLYEEQGTIGYYLGTTEESERSKNLKQIINALEKAMSKKK